METVNLTNVDPDLKKESDKYADLHQPKKDTKEDLQIWLDIRLHYYSGLKSQKDKQSIRFVSKIKNSLKNVFKKKNI